MKRWFVGSASLLTAVALVATGCGSSKKSTSSTESTSSGAKGGTLMTVANAAPSGSPDPQVNYTLQEWQLLIITHDGLVGFKRAGGKEGTKIVPDLAESIPKPTNGGKTWTFTLRKGIKFSNGKALTGADVKATFERLFKIGDSPNAGTWYNVIRGADVCIKTPKTCDLSSGITVNGNKVTFKLTTADPEWLDKLSVPFAYILPAGTPAKNVNIPPPGTGPYMWAEYAPNKQIKLVRNPYFKVWSQDAQPSGNPDIIIQKFGLTVEAEVTQVQNNQADWMFDQPPADRLGELSSPKYASRVHVNPLTATYYFALNVNVPPFNNLKARQGLNFATDRAALVKIAGGPKLAVPTCQVLPPNFPGYEPYCPYTKNPGTGGRGKWTAPDLAKARQRINASGNAVSGEIAVNTDTTDTDKALGLYFVGLLNQLGYKATLQALSADIQYPYIQNSKNKVQIAFSDWFQDYPAASDFLNILLGCNSIHPNSIAQFCNKAIQAQMDHAGQVGITDPAAANKIWAQVDKAVTDQAPWVAMYNPKYIDFLSERVKGYVFSPQWYFLLDQASVK